MEAVGAVGAVGRRHLGAHQPRQHGDGVLAYTIGMLNLQLRRQERTLDAGRHTAWTTTSTDRSIPAREAAIVICDMWDNHWSRGAAERVNVMAPRMNQVLCAARDKGVLIIHAPSETMDFYAGTPARLRALSATMVEPPNAIDHPDPPLPIDDSDEGSDTGEAVPYTAWTRQHAAIEIDQDKDAISDDGHQVYSLLHKRNIRLVLLMGVHTNMCVLNRSFAIKQMVRWGVDVALVRDLTDTMYNPAMRPYVSHDGGTRLVVEFIEKFWCPTIDSEQL